MINTETGTLITVNLAPYIAGYPMKAELSRMFGVPVCVDQDARALLVGDRWFGLGRGLNNFAVVYTGEVLGAALYLNGHLYRGPAGAGGEVGHTTVQLGGRSCKCGRSGCWETIATLGWLREQAFERKLPYPTLIDGPRLVRLVNENVSGAADLLSQYACNLAIGLANLQQVMAPNIIILHGDVARGGKRLGDLIRKKFMSLILRRPGDEVNLLLGGNEDFAALRGAAGLVLSDLLNFSL